MKLWLANTLAFTGGIFLLLKLDIIESYSVIALLAAVFISNLIFLKPNLSNGQIKGHVIFGYSVILSFASYAAPIITLVVYSILRCVLTGVCPIA